MMKGRSGLMTITTSGDVALGVLVSAVYKGIRGINGAK